MFFGILLGLAVIGLLIVRELINRNALKFEEALTSLDKPKKIWNNEDEYHGIELAAKMKADYRLDTVQLKIDGWYRSSYVHNNNAVHLGKEFALSKSITALTIVMHEMMHAVQHNGKKNIFTVLKKMRIFIKVTKRCSFVLIVVASIATYFYGMNIFYELAIMLPLTLVFIEYLIEVYIENDAWKKVKCSKVMNEIVQTEEEKKEAERVMKAAFQSYVLFSIKSFFVIVIVGAFICIIKNHTY